LLLALAAHAAEPAFRHAAPVTVTQPGAFVQLPLPPSAYARSARADLGDLRLLDARGERVPYAWLPPRGDRVAAQEVLSEAAIYALPRRTAPNAALGLPVEVMVQGDSIRVRRPAAGATVAASPGWLFDIGEPKPDQPVTHALRLAWSNAADFSAAYDIDVSADLRSWRPGGSGQLLALSSPSGPLVQHDVPLPHTAPRFVRLVWRDLATAPALTGANAVVWRQTRQAQDEPTELRVAASSTASATIDAKALVFDLGAALPLATLDLELPAGTRVAPVHVQGRVGADEAWRELGSAVFYRIERDGQVSRSPPWPLQATVRYVRVWPDERSPALDATATQLVLRAHLAHLLFAAQGQPPYRLLAGATTATPGALPVATLVPQLEEERPRFGRAELGAWSEDAGAAAQATAAERRAALRPWLLWSVLLAGVAALGVMVWRLARRR
jgi:hypothetical protein